MANSAEFPQMHPGCPSPVLRGGARVRGFFISDLEPKILTPDHSAKGRGGCEEFGFRAHNRGTGQSDLQGELDYRIKERLGIMTDHESEMPSPTQTAKAWMDALNDVFALEEKV